MEPRRTGIGFRIFDELASTYMQILLLKHEEFQADTKKTEIMLRIQHSAPLDLQGRICHDPRILDEHSDFFGCQPSGPACRDKQELSKPGSLGHWTIDKKTSLSSRMAPVLAGYGC